MKVELTPDIEAKLSKLAQKSRTTPEQLLVAAATALVEGKALTPERGGKTTSEVDSRGRILPARHLAGGIITPQ